MPTGGRTAWSATVTVQQQTVAAKYWYDGQYVNNAKEDAAEMALLMLGGSPAPPTLASKAGEGRPVGSS